IRCATATRWPSPCSRSRRSYVHLILRGRSNRRNAGRQPPSLKPSGVAGAATPLRFGGPSGLAAMCGIAGIAHADVAGPVSPDLVARMCTAMQHRGPDDRGLFTEGPVSLGMQRLSIIDLPGGCQPLFNEDYSKC